MQEEQLYLYRILSVCLSVCQLLHQPTLSHDKHEKETKSIMAKHSNQIKSPLHHHHRPLTIVMKVVVVVVLGEVW